MYHVTTFSRNLINFQCKNDKLHFNPTKKSLSHTFDQNEKKTPVKTQTVDTKHSHFQNKNHESQMNRNKRKKIAI